MGEKYEEDFSHFEERLKKELLSHQIILNNQYCKWFASVELSLDDVKYFTQQFSVFSNLFIVAQLYKTINSVDLQEMRSAKEILANELGCVFHGKEKKSEADLTERSTISEDEEGSDLVNTEGTVDGGTFRFEAAHFEWLLSFAKPLGLKFENLGKRKHGSKSTLFFCDELIRIYGSTDYNESAGASFAVENWAAAGFWKELIQGLKRFKKNKIPELHLGFFTWHDKVEDQHKEQTHDEMKELYFGPHPFDENKFIAAGREMLDGVAAFWDGLNKERLQRQR